jgi:hypothetical protein
MTRGAFLTEADLPERLRPYLTLTEAQVRMVESIRYRDQDHSVKSSGILALCGLIIAANFVQISAPRDAFAFVEKGLPRDLTLASILLLALACGLTLCSFGLSLDWPGEKDVWRIIVNYDRLMGDRNRIEIAATACLGLAGACTLATLGLKVLAG